MDERFNSVLIELLDVDSKYHYLDYCYTRRLGETEDEEDSEQSHLRTPGSESRLSCGWVVDPAVSKRGGFPKLLCVCGWDRFDVVERI